MVRLLVKVALSAMLVAGLSGTASAVDMTGDWYSLAGPTVKLPVLGPHSPCTPAGVGACVQIFTVGQPGGFAGSPAGGGVPGSETGIAAGKLVGDPIRVAPGVFGLPGNTATPRFEQVPQDFAVRQLNTSISFTGPGATVNVGLEPGFQIPGGGPALTRQLSAMNWSNPNGGQGGRLAANTSPIVLGQLFTTYGAGGAPATAVSTFPVNISYTAGANEFGGTMSLLLEGNGTLYLNGSAIQVSPNAVGLVRLRTPAATGKRARPFGVGWNIPFSATQPAGDIRVAGSFGPPCTGNLPPSPASCELVVNSGIPLPTANGGIGLLPPAASSLIAFAWTTGTVVAQETGTIAGNPGTNTLSVRGKDTTTVGGNRNISLVAGGVARRVAPPGPLGWTVNMGSLDMTLVPEPASSAALIAGMGLLAFVARRSRR